MKFGYSIPSNQGFEDVHELIALAKLAEEHGLDSVWASEHLFHTAYIAERLGNRPYYEPLTILTAVAAATSKVRLGTSVLVAPWHDPPRLAKTVATLDQLSNGRVDLGVGVAMTEDEFENLGVDFKTRGRRTDDLLGALKVLWTEETPEYQGKFYSYSGQKFSPKPKQTPYPPILIGGGSKAALRRAARFGDGWHALRKSPNQIRESLGDLAGLCEAEGRDPSSLQISISIPIAFDLPASQRAAEDQSSLKGQAADIAATIAAYEQAGVHEMVISLSSREFTAHAQMLQQLSQQVMPLCN
jgi:probable F420-dependent oxidoreductase